MWQSPTFFLASVGPAIGLFPVAYVSAGYLPPWFGAQSFQFTSLSVGRVTTEASCSALVVTDRLLLTLHTVFFLLYWSSCHKTEEIFIWSPHRSQRELGFSKNRANAAQLLLYSMTIVPTVGSFPLLCTLTSPIGVFGFCFGVYCPHALQPFLESWSGILKGE